RVAAPPTLLVPTLLRGNEVCNFESYDVKVPHKSACWLLAALLALAATSARAGDWPNWRGPTGMGLVEDQNLPLTWSARDRQNILWSVPLPGADGGNRLDHNQSSPIVWRDRVFLIMVWWPAG